MAGGRLGTTLLAAAAGFVLGAFTVWAVGGDAPRPADDRSTLTTGTTGTTGDAASARPSRAPSPPSSPAAPKRAGRAAPPGTADPADGVGGANVEERGEARGTREARSARVGPGGRDPMEPDPSADAADGPHVAGTNAEGPRPGEVTSVVVKLLEGTPPPVREASGVVVDAATQQPIAGARILLAVAEGPQAGSWWGDTTGEDGAFHPRVGGGDDLGGAHLEVRVSKDGYEPTRVPAAKENMRVELRIRGASPMPGRVAGTARSADGKPLAGEIEVEGADEHGNNASQIVVADARGAFVLEGVPPGRWRLRVGSGTFVGTTVPDGGETRVDLSSPKPGEESGFVVTDVDPSAVKPKDPAMAERAAALRALLESLAPEQSPALDDAARDRLLRAVAQEFQRLDASSRATLPRRDVAVTGLGAAAGGLRGWLRLDVKPRLFRRVEIADGVARFTAVPVGPYAAVLVVPGRPDAVRTIVVTPGEGPFEAPWAQ